jgi:alpha-mannosidase
MRTLHLISHTHWDREWYFTFQQFRLKLVRLIDGLLEILESDGGYRHFMLDGQTIVLDDYLVMRPERKAILHEHIHKGRILVGPWHILPDEFLVSPEATIRNLLQGERTTRRYGPKMKVGYIPDPFGHIGQMPQILRGFGIDAAALRRGLADEPCEVWWEAPDGSRLLTAYLRDGYDNAAGLPASEPERFITEVCRLRDSLSPHSVAADLLLMHGTDHMEPDPDTTPAIRASKGKLGGDRLIHSTLPGYFKSVRKRINNSEIPTVHGELRSSKKHHLLPGVLSTRMWIKQRNKTCETLLEKWVEPFSTWAGWSMDSGHRPLVQNPAEIIRQAWRLLMENHPHDSICGCSIDQVHEEMRPRFDQVEQIGEELTRQSLVALAEGIDTRGGNAPNRQAREAEGYVGAIVVFNPAAGARTDMVTVELTLPPDVAELEIMDENGTVIPHQRIGSGARELINSILDREGFAVIIGSLHEGRAANLSIQDFSYSRKGDVLSIEAVMAENGEPKKEVWERCVEAIKSQLNDPAITHFHVRARSNQAVRIAFMASQVPGHGWRTFLVRGTPVKDPLPARIPPFLHPLMPLAMRLAQSGIGQRLYNLASEQPHRQHNHIENEFFIVRAERDGTLTVTDKRDGTIIHGLNRFMDEGDRGDEYNFCPVTGDRQKSARSRSVLVQNNSVQKSMEIKLLLRIPAELTLDRESRARQVVNIPISTRVLLLPGVPRIDIQTEVENRAKDGRLRVHFPTQIHTEHACHDGHFEVVRRPVGIPQYDSTWVEQPRSEVPQRNFTDVSDGKLGLMVANYGLPEVEVIKAVNGNEIALTLLRCVGWLSRDDLSTRRGHAGPFLATPGAQMNGRWTFQYSIIPHRGGWEEGFEQAYHFEVPLRAVCTTNHGGKLPVSASFIQVSTRMFVISAVKQAENDRGWLVRGYNISGEELPVTLKPWRRFKRVERVNLVERKISSLVPGEDGSVSLTARGHEIVSVVFRE